MVFRTALASNQLCMKCIAAVRAERDFLLALLTGVNTRRQVSSFLGRTAPLQMFLFLHSQKLFEAIEFAK
jgi:hypothetical protein